MRPAQNGQAADNQPRNKSRAPHACRHCRKVSLPLPITLSFHNEYVEQTAFNMSYTFLNKIVMQLNNFATSCGDKSEDSFRKYALARSFSPEHSMYLVGFAIGCFPLWPK